MIIIVVQDSQKFELLKSSESTGWWDCTMHAISLELLTASFNSTLNRCKNFLLRQFVFDELCNCIIISHLPYNMLFNNRKPNMNRGMRYECPAVLPSNLTFPRLYRKLHLRLQVVSGESPSTNSCFFSQLTSKTISQNSSFMANLCLR